MNALILNRRNLLTAGGSVLALGASGLLRSAAAQGLEPTASMRVGANNYHAHKGAPIVERIGKGGFVMKSAKDTSLEAHFVLQPA